MASQEAGVPAIPMSTGAGNHRGGTATRALPPIDGIAREAAASTPRILAEHDA
jgi:hypothetical protein